MSDWIGVKERLPEKGRDGLGNSIDDVLIAYNMVCRHCLSPHNKNISIGYYMDGKWCLAEPLPNQYVFHCEHNERILVTHWMPLPPLPEKTNE